MACSKAPDESQPDVTDAPSDQRSIIRSVNVGLPRPMRWHGGTVTTGIVKMPVPGPVRISRLGLAGDGQADLTVHGGPEKAVYAYPSEHYATWARETGLPAWPAGTFGENLTIEGLREEDVRIGDCFRVGTAEVVVTQPRMPCGKLSARLCRPEVIRRFLSSARTGWYLAVSREGIVQAGDPMVRLSRSRTGATIAELAHALGNGARSARARAARRSG